MGALTAPTVLAACAAVAGLLLAPGIAAGDSIAVNDGVLRIDAAPGESNWYRLAPGPGGTIEVEDNSASQAGTSTQPTLGPGCEPPPPGAGTPGGCRGANSVLANLGDTYRDHFDGSAISLPSVVNGDADEDLILTGSGADALSGGDGTDALWGGLGPDAFSGGPGADDVIHYDDDVHAAGITVTLDGIADDGLPGEGDNVRAGDAETIVGTRGPDTFVAGATPSAIEGAGGDDKVTGGPADEVLSGDCGYLPCKDSDEDGGALGNPGDEGDDVVNGEAGDDKIYGSDGNDKLTGGKGKDRIIGAKGSDKLRAADGKKDYVDCGNATDRATVDAVDTVKACEKVRIRK